MQQFAGCWLEHQSMNALMCTYDMFRSHVAINRYCDVYAINKTGSSSDDWIYSQLVTHSLIITLTHRQYSFISRLHQLQFTVAHALGFLVATSRLLATDVDAQTVTVLLSKYSTHFYMNFFDHKDLGNHLLQLCPKVVKHPVYDDFQVLLLCILMFHDTQVV
jgi:hypothetical protein